MGMRNFAIGVIMSAVDRVTAPMRGIRASLSGLTTGARQASTGMDGLGRAMGALRGVVATLGIGMAVKGMNDLVKGTIEYGDTLNDLSGVLGMSTRALQEYQYVGQLTGLSTDEMNTALQKLTVNLGKGSGEVDEAIQSMGLSIEQLRASAPDQRLELIADAMARIQDPTRRAALTTTLFGRSSARMTNTLAMGAQGLRELRQEANRMGAVMGDDAVQAAAAADDEMNRFQARMKGLTNTLGSRLVPVLTDSIRAIGSWVEQNKDKIDSVVGAVSGSITTVVACIRGFLPHVLKLANAVGGFLTAAFKVMGIESGKVSGILKVLGDAIGGVLDFVSGLVTALTPFAPIIVGIVGALTAWQVATGIMTAAQWALNIAMSANPIGIIIVLIGALIGAIAMLAMNWDKVTKWFGDTFNSIAKWFEEMRQKTIDKMRQDLTNMMAFFGQVGEFFKGVFQGIGDFFVGVWTGVGDFFGGLWEGIIQGVQSAVDWIMGLLKPVTDAIGWVVDGVSGLFGGGKSTPGGAPVSSSAPPLRNGAPGVSGRDGTQKTEVVVDFKNMPRGTRVQSDGARQGLNMNMGYANVGF